MNTEAKPRYVCAAAEVRDLVGGNVVCKTRGLNERIAYQAAAEIADALNRADTLEQDRETMDRAIRQAQDGQQAADKIAMDLQARVSQLERQNANLQQSYDHVKQQGITEHERAKEREAALTRERDVLKKERDNLDEAYENLGGYVLEKEILALRAALRKYGRHTPECAIEWLSEDENPACDCGWNGAALEAAGTSPQPAPLTGSDQAD